MGNAIDYALGQWSTLLIFLSDGRLEIDNNLIENAIRPTAVGKKNWLFIGEAAAASAAPSSTRSSRTAAGVVSTLFAYLKDVFTRLPSMTNWQVKDITPKAWAKGNIGRPSSSGCIDVIALSALTSTTKTPISDPPSQDAPHLTLTVMSPESLMGHILPNNPRNDRIGDSATPAGVVPRFYAVRGYHPRRRVQPPATYL